MSIIAIGMNLMLASLLAAALVLGVRLNNRLKALRDSHDSFAKAVAELDVAAARAEQGLADLRAATDEATDQLADRIEKARALSSKLDRQLQGQPATASRPVREEADPLGAGRLERLGAILSSAREPRPQPERARKPSLAVASVRPRSEVEDDLFDNPGPRVSIGSLRGRPT